MTALRDIAEGLLRRLRPAQESRSAAEPAADQQLDRLGWRSRGTCGLEASTAWLSRQRHAGTVTLRLKLSDGEHVAVTMPLRAADRLAREILRAPVLQSIQRPTCRRPPRWLAGAFPLRTGNRLPRSHSQGQSDG